VVILQLSSVYIMHTVWNWCEVETQMWFYCSCFCLYCAYCFELVQIKDLVVVILQLSSVYFVHIVFKWCKTETEMWL